MKCKIFVTVFSILCFGCGPLNVDFNMSLGANQEIERSLKVTQKQTKAQVEAQSGVIEDIVSAIPPVFMRSAPAPTPTPAAVPAIVKSVTIEVEPLPTPVVPRLVVAEPDCELQTTQKTQQTVKRKVNKAQPCKK